MISTKFSAFRTGFASFLMAIISCISVQQASADIVYSYTNLPSSSNVRGLIVELDVKHSAGIRISDIGIRVAGSGDGQRSYGLYYFAGAYDRDVEGSPAHQANLWSQIGQVPLTTIVGQSFLNFTLNRGDAADGSLILSQGLYTFMFYTESNTLSTPSNNGVVARSEPAGVIGTILAPLDPAASQFVDLLAVSTVQSLNGALTTSAPMRTPGNFIMTFTAIPEPGGAGLLLGLFMTRCLVRRRV
jgi:hypothetical protein